MDRDRLALGIRVLEAIALDGRDPELEDTNRIRALAKSERERQMPIDDLARTIIQRETFHRKAAKYALAS